MYRNKQQLADKSYRETNIELDTRADALQEIQNLISRFDHKLKSISEQPAAQSKENIELINRAKKHRLMMKEAFGQIENADDNTWADIRPEVQKSFAEAKDEAAKY